MGCERGVGLVQSARPNAWRCDAAGAESRPSYPRGAAAAPASSAAPRKTPLERSHLLASRRRGARAVSMPPPYHA